MSIQEYKTFRTRGGYEARIYGTKTIGEKPILYGTIIEGIPRLGLNRDCWGAWHENGRDIQGIRKFNLVMTRTKG